MIDVTCPKCGGLLSVPSSLRGKAETCPTCKAMVTVPRTVGAEMRNARWCKRKCKVVTMRDGPWRTKMAMCSEDDCDELCTRRSSLVIGLEAGRKQLCAEGGMLGSHDRSALLLQMGCWDYAPACPWPLDGREFFPDDKQYALAQAEQRSFDMKNSRAADLHPLAILAAGVCIGVVTALLGAAWWSLLWGILGSIAAFIAVVLLGSTRFSIGGPPGQDYPHAALLSGGHQVMIQELVEDLDKPHPLEGHVLSDSAGEKLRYYVLEVPGSEVGDPDDKQLALQLQVSLCSAVLSVDPQNEGIRDALHRVAEQTTPEKLEEWTFGAWELGHAQAMLAKGQTEEARHKLKIMAESHPVRHQRLGAQCVLEMLDRMNQQGFEWLESLGS